jgi:two-component system alkaline phosphatase synthesis response regulator PhoP
MSQLRPDNYAATIPGPVLSMPAESSALAAVRPRKILIVDDNQVIIKTMTFKLKLKGYEVCAAMDGSDAVSMVRRERPDLILLDVNFPPDVAHGGGIAWDGFLILDWLRRIDEARYTPVIFMSSGDYQDRALAAGAVAFFQKPVNPESLLSVVQRILRTDENAV